MSLPILPLISPFSIIEQNSARSFERSGIVDIVTSFAFFRYAMMSPVSQFAACFAGAPAAIVASKYSTRALSSTKTCTASSGKPSAAYLARIAAGNSGISALTPSTYALSNTSGGRSGSGKYR